MSRSAVAGRRLFVVCRLMLRAFIAGVLTTASCGGSVPRRGEATVRHLIYAAQDDGTIHVYDVDGRRGFMETRSPTGAIYVARTATNRVVATVIGYCCGGVLGPFSLNSRATLMVNDVVGFNGFALADVMTGHVIASISAGPSGTP